MMTPMVQKNAPIALESESCFLEKKSQVSNITNLVLQPTNLKSVTMKNFYKWALHDAALMFTLEIN